MLTLVNKGMLREEAYRLVQGHAMRSWEEKLDYKELILQDTKIMNFITGSEIEVIFDLKIYTNQVDYIFKRCGLA